MKFSETLIRLTHVRMFVRQQAHSRPLAAFCRGLPINGAAGSGGRGLAVGEGRGEGEGGVAGHRRCGTTATAAGVGASHRAGGRRGGDQLPTACCWNVSQPRQQTDGAAQVLGAGAGVQKKFLGFQFMPCCHALSQPPSHRLCCAVRWCFAVHSLALPSSNPHEAQAGVSMVCSNVSGATHPQCKLWNIIGRNWHAFSICSASINCTNHQIILIQKYFLNARII